MSFGGEILEFASNLLCIQDGWSFPDRTMQRKSTQSQESKSKQSNYISSWKKKYLETGNLKSFRIQQKMSFHCNSFLSVLVFPGVNTAMQYTLGGRRVKVIIPGSCRTV